MLTNIRVLTKWQRYKLNKKQKPQEVYRVQPLGKPNTRANIDSYERENVMTSKSLILNSHSPNTFRMSIEEEKNENNEYTESGKTLFLLQKKCRLKFHH